MSIQTTTSAHRWDVWEHGPGSTTTAVASHEHEPRAPHGVARVAFFVGLALSAQLVLRPAAGVTASDVAFGFALAAAALGLSFALRGPSGFLPPGIAAGAGLFLAGACVSSFGSGAPVAAFGAPLRFLVIVLAWFWLASLVLPRLRDVTAAVACWVLSVAVSGGAAIAQLVAGDVIPNTDVDWARMTGTAQHVNDLGGSAAVALPVAAALALASRAGHQRLLAVLAVVLITTGLVLSGSIGSLLGAVAGLAVAAGVAGRKAAFARAALAVGAAAAATAWFQAAQVSAALPERLDAVGGPSGTFAARIRVFDQAWERIAESPLVGVGFGFDPRQPGSELPDLIHNALLGVWYQGGLLAAVGLAVICLAAARMGVRTVRAAATDNERLLSASLLGSFAAYLVFGLGEPTLYARYGWIPVALLLALGAAHNRRAPGGVVA